jgi:ribonuclease E
MRMLMPSHEDSVIQYKEPQPIFARYGVEHQLDAMFSPTVQLRSGGYIVINPTEALVSIDVNSGRSTREHHIEDTALKTNMEAAEEIARQLRLRDLAGLIVIDFIDMEEKRNNRNVERKLKDALRHDRARIQVGRISHFGLMEMSRQRIRTGVLESSTEICPSCGGTGHVRSVSSVALQLLRGIEDQLMKGASHDVVARAKPDVALYVLNHKRAHLRALEDQFGVMITIQSDATLTGQQSFAIERGGIARQKPAAATRISPDSVAVEIGEEHEAAEETEHTHTHAHTADSGEAEEHHERGGRRGRRRRGRRGRGGQREQTHSHDDAQHAEAPEHGEAMEHAGEHAPSGNGEGRNGEGPDGEPRKRRRRGRRGGRRNRGERDNSREPVNFEAHQSGSDFEAEGMPDAPANDAPDAVPAPARAEPPQEAAHASGPAPKRRSTVREAAPISFEQSEGSNGSAPSSPAPREEAENRGGGEIEPERPRRSGWWSKFRGG